MDAGAMRDRVELLNLESTAGRFEWVAAEKLWAKVELTGKRNLFSSIGIGARDAALTIRARPITLHQAIRYKGQHLFLTEITTPVRGWAEVKAALVEPILCRANAEVDDSGPTFPGVLTEKYLSFAQREPQVENTITYVLVTPKAVELPIESLVQVGNELMVVRAAHLLDPYKHEYEVERRFEP